MNSFQRTRPRVVAAAAGTGLLPACRISHRREAGVDEAGRGPLAGPVVAAAVVLPSEFAHPLLQDSKRLSPTQRLEARSIIWEHALAWSLGMGSVGLIDRINILQATLRAMQEAVAGLSVAPEVILVDGNRGFPYSCPVELHVRGDTRFAHIAAASILAKTYRDEIMAGLHRTFPHYGWDRNRGYPTPAHRRAIETWGPSPWHRRSFMRNAPALLFPDAP